MDLIQFVPAIHLLSLQVATIFKKLNVIKEEANHSIGFVQIPLHHSCVLDWFTCIKESDILQQTRQSQLPHNSCFQPSDSKQQLLDLWTHVIYGNNSCIDEFVTVLLTV